MAWVAPKGKCALCGGPTGRRSQLRCQPCYSVAMNVNVVCTAQEISPWEQMPDGVMRRTVEGGAPMVRY